MSSCARPQQTINKTAIDVSATQVNEKGKRKGKRVRIGKRLKPIGYIPKTKLEFSLRTRTLNIGARQSV